MKIEIKISFVKDLKKMDNNILQQIRDLISFYMGNSWGNVKKEY